MSQRDLAGLARSIAAEATRLSEYLDSQGLPQPTIATDATGIQLPADAHDQHARLSALLADTRELHHLLRGPIGSISALGAHEFDLAALHTIHTFNVAAAVPASGSTTFAAVAAETGLPERTLRRVLRHAMTNYFFREPSPGLVAHTPRSALLSSDARTRSTVGMICDEQFPAAAAFAAALRRSSPSSSSLTAADATAPTTSPTTAWALANSAPPAAPMMAHLQAHEPRRAAQFDAFMRFAWAAQHPLQPLRDNVDWAGLGAGAHVVDVGGGLGTASIALARAFPSLRCTVQDLAPVVARAREAELPAEVGGRVAFAEHNFFAEQPVKNADVYLLRSILHDWPDGECVRILRALVPALKRGARVLVHDFCMPAPGEMTGMAERQARTLDLVMTAFFDGREREADEWAPLFERADARYRFLGVRRAQVNETGLPASSLLSFIEAVWDG